VTAVAVGCGGGTKPIPRQTPEDAVRAAAVAGVLASGSNEQCLHWGTHLVTRVYGSVSRCKRLVARSSASPNFDANVIAAKVAGQRALVRVLVKNGDDPDIAGTVTLHYERAAWRIDDFDADYLRSALGKL
jgi:hypothetical protein